MKWQSIPSWQIVLLCTGVGAFFAFWISLVPQWPGGPEPTRLPPLPTAAASFYSFDTTHFFQADPSIRTIDGQIYSLIGQPESYAWQSSLAPSTVNNGEACSPESIRLIEGAASAVIECRTVLAHGEWCSGSIVSIAITEKGEVWRLGKVPPCLFRSGINFLFLVPIGILLGVFVVGFRQSVLIRFKSNTSH